MSRTPGGDIALLETIRVHHGRAPLWPLHLARLQRSTSELALPLPETLPRPSGGGDHVLRYTVAGGRVYVAGRALEAVESIRLVTSAVEHVGYPHKTDHRNWLDDARLAATESGGDDALLLDPHGLVVEASIWAIGWWTTEGLAFPPLTLCGLRSVSRRRVGELTRILDVRLPGEELLRHAVVACNAARGLVVVSHLDGVELPLDPRTEELQASFWHRPEA